MLTLFCSTYFELSVFIKILIIFFFFTFRPSQESEVIIITQGVEVDKKDDSGNETGAGEPEVDDDQNGYTGYDKTKSFFDNISCEAVER